MAEDLGKLSPEQIKQLAGVISDAKSLTSQQADIIERVLTGETDIGKLRIANLREYFDIYSRNLDLIARKHSELNDALLVLDKQLNENYKKAVSNDHPKAKQKDNKPVVKETENIQKDKSAKSEKDSNSGSGNNPPPTNPPAQKTPGKGKDHKNFNTTPDEDRNKLNSFDETDLQQRAEQLARFFQKTESERRDIIISEQAYIKVIEDRKKEASIRRLKEHLNNVEKLEESIMDLEILRHQNEKDAQEQLAGIRISRLQESIKVENEAQTLINKISTELAYIGDTTPYAQGGQDADNNDTSIKTKNAPEQVATTESIKQDTPNENKFAQAAVPETNIKDIATTALTVNGLLQYAKNEKEIAVTKEPKDGTTNLINKITSIFVDPEKANIGNNGQKITEAGETKARLAEAKDKLKAAQEFENNIIAYRTRKEREARLKNNGILTKEASSRIEQEISKKFTLEKLNDKKRIEERAKLEAEVAAREAQANIRRDLDTLTAKDKTYAERKEALRNLTHDESGEFDGKKTAAVAITSTLKALSNAAAQLEKKIDDIGEHKGAIDTRLQGSSNQTSGGSYWDQLTKDMISLGAITPFFKQETFANNIKDLVNKGIAFDLKQRAFLMTIQEKIANTFDVADGTLLRLVRIQQEDSTAGRLGMESALNTFLNNMYETSEYLSQVADSVRGNLEEMEALMQGAEAAEVEYQVQKWLGSLYSVGMSQSAVQGISDTLGKIAAGQIEGLTGGGAGNLLVMAANDAGLSIADILTGGISSDQTNDLLQAAVNYLAELSNSAKDNKVVQQQLAEVFGVRASDLKAATNLVAPGSVKNIYNSTLLYGDMLEQLTAMAGSMGDRTSMSEMMTNLWDNGMYTLASSMANNPVSYFIYKVANLVDSAAGGINIPFVNVLGSGVDLNASVADLMRVGAVGYGLLGSFGSVISGLNSSFSTASMLNKLGIGNGSGLTITPRGTGAISLGSTGTTSVSESGYVGNASSSDIKDATLQEAADTKKQQMIEAKESEEANQIDILNTTALKIYELLDDVANGDKSLRVKVDTYGLTKIASGSGALAGISGASTNGVDNGYGVNSGVVSGSVDLGGWR